MRTLPGIRVGVLVPAGNLVHEREFARLRPDAVDFRFAGFDYPAAGPRFCGDMLEQFAGPLRELRTWGAQLVLVGCTTASMQCAQGAWAASLQEIAQVPVITAAAAVNLALDALHIHSVAVATPYGDANNRIIAHYLESQQVAVPAIRGMALDRSPQTWRAAPQVTAQQMLEFSLGVDVEAAQALYLPCTGVTSIETVELFERRRAKPALSSVQAGYWASLRRLGIDGRREDGGRLLRCWDF